MSLVDLAKSAEEREQEEGRKNTTATSTHNNNNNNKSNEDSRNVMIDDVDLGEPQAKRICSPRASPSLPSMSMRVPSPPHNCITIPALATLQQYSSNATLTKEGTPATTPPGPSSFSWGQFVDMLIPEEEEGDLCSSSSLSSTSSRNHWSHHDRNNNYINNNKHCYNSNCWCYSRRSSPYSHLNTRTNRAIMSRPPPSSLHLQEYTLSSSHCNHNNLSKFRLTPRKNASIKNNDQELLIVGALAGLNF
jgi:hypothetical protein